MQIANKRLPKYYFNVRTGACWLFTSAKVVKTTNPQLMQARLQKTITSKGDLLMQISNAIHQRVVLEGWY
jgi:hypothetical protein